MSDIIYKYELSLGLTSLRFPLDAEVLSAQMQDGKLCIWVKQPEPVIATRVLQQRTFLVVGTGRSLKGIFTHIDTVQDGSFVWHVFEKAYNGL